MPAQYFDGVEDDGGAGGRGAVSGLDDQEQDAMMVGVTPSNVNTFGGGNVLHVGGGNFLRAQSPVNKSNAQHSESLVRRGGGDIEQVYSSPDDGAQGDGERELRKKNKRTFKSG